MRVNPNIREFTLNICARGISRAVARQNFNRPKDNSLGNFGDAIVKRIDESLNGIYVFARKPLRVIDVDSSARTILGYSMPQSE